MRADPRLPRLSARVLRWAALRLGTPEVEADAVELFEERAARDGLIAARRWYRRQARIAARQALRPQPRPRSGASGVGVITFADATLRELRLGARRLRRRPGAAVSFAAVVGTGIAAASFMAQVRTSMFNPDGGLGRAAESVVWIDSQEQGTPFIPLSGNEGWLAGSPGPIGALVAIWPTRGTLRSPTGLIRVTGERVLAGHLGRLGVVPVRGRDLERPGEIILSWDLWLERWEGANDAVGSTVHVDGTPQTIVGVAPATFNGPLCCVPPDFWTLGEELDSPSPARLIAVDVTDRTAGETRLTELTNAQLSDRRAALGHPMGRPFGGDSGTVGQVLSLLFGLSLAVWVMTLLSGANLILSDTLTRRRELRLRTAIGARNGHTMARTLVETGWLAALAALLAVVATAAMATVAPWLLPILSHDSVVTVQPGQTTFVVAAVGAALSAVACALPASLAALRLSRSANVDRGAARSRFAGVGLAVQVALACGMVLLTGVFVTTIRDLNGEFVGFRDGATAVHFLSAATPVDPDVVLRAATSSEPGLRVALTSRLPVYGAAFDSITFADGSRFQTAVEVVTPGFFAAIGTQLLAGTAASSRGEVVISAGLAQRLGGDQAALGAQLVVADSVPLRVTGVVEDATWGGGQFRPTVYRGWGPAPFSNAVLLVSHGEDGGSGIGPLLTAFGPAGVALEPFDTMDGLLIRSHVVEVFQMRLATGFGFLALLVAIGAIHSHFMRWIRARERDMAIRAALGAPLHSLGGKLLQSALRNVLPGMMLGAFLGWGSARLIGQTMGPFSPLTLSLAAATGAVVMAATAVALIGPLVRTGKIKPLRLLRDE